MNLPFFVYGTLRPGEVNHDAFLRGRTAAEEPAGLPGAVMYDGPGYPYVLLDPGAGSTVHGELVTARPEAYDELLTALDRLEGHVPGGRRNLYDRIERRVVRRDGSTAAAWVYVAAPPVAARLRARGTRIPSGDWLNRSQGPPRDAPRTP